MKHAARLETAIDLLARMSAGKIPMDNVIRDYMAQRRFIGSKDRTAVVERVYRIMRSHARLGWWLERCAMEDRARNRVLADLILTERPDPSYLETLFAGGKHEPAPLEERERRFIAALEGQEIDHDDMPEAVRCECPAWAEPLLREIYANDFSGQLRAMIPPAPLDLRVNTVKAPVDDVLQSLQADGVKAEKCRYSPVGLRAPAKTFMGDTKAFKKGYVEIQDEGSQLIGLLCGVQPGMRVLDYCAGGGGKTLVLAAMMENKGNIVAMDNDARRLEKGRPRYRKAGIHNVELRCLEEEQHRKWLRRQKGTMDVVLVDAPCSSSGTWRRNPDLRWRWFGPKLDEIMTAQEEILDRVADKVKPGGRLVYATCSLFPEENERQIEKFLEKHPDFTLLPLDQAWGWNSSPPCKGEYMRLSPHEHGTDGFFAAIMTRSAG